MTGNQTNVNFTNGSSGNKQGSNTNNIRPIDPKQVQQDEMFSDLLFSSNKKSNVTKY